MKTKTTETTKTNQTITFNRSVKDDSGVDIAKMSATVNAATPFGNTSFVVLNRSLFEENKDEIKKLYSSFQEEVSNTSLDDGDTTIETDNEETILCEDDNEQTE